MRYWIIIAALFCTMPQPLPAAGHLAHSHQNDYFFAAPNSILLAQADELDRGLHELDGEDLPRKSSAKAMVLSLLLPGLGEVYAGNSGRAAGFFVAEAGIWGTYAFFKSKQGWLEDDYINFAVEHAGIDPDGKDERFYDMLGFYDNRDDYNKFSRVYNRSNPFFPETPEWDWQWSSSELRRQYRDIKNSSDAQGRNANFTLGAALANRVLSAVDAWWCVKKYNMRFSPLAGTIRIRLKPSPSDLMRGDSSPGLSVSYSRSF